MQVAGGMAPGECALLVMSNFLDNDVELPRQWDRSSVNLRQLVAYRREFSIYTCGHTLLKSLIPLW